MNHHCTLLLLAIFAIFVCAHCAIPARFNTDTYENLEHLQRRARTRRPPPFFSAEAVSNLAPQQSNFPFERQHLTSTSATSPPHFVTPQQQQATLRLDERVNEASPLPDWKEIMALLASNPPTPAPSVMMRTEFANPAEADRTMDASSSIPNHWTSLSCPSMSAGQATDGSENLLSSSGQSASLSESLRDEEEEEEEEEGDGALSMTPQSARPVLETLVEDLPSNPRPQRKRKGQSCANTIASSSKAAVGEGVEAVGEKETKKQRAIPPFWLTDVPDTRVGRLFEKYEARYWEAEATGESKPKYFFKLKPEERKVLDDEERDQFRTLSKIFTGRVYDRRRVKSTCAQWRLKNLGPRGLLNKTPEQQKKARINSLRTNLNHRLRMILKEGLYKKPWTWRNCRMLKELDEATTLRSTDRTVRLYKQLLAATPGMQSCIKLPP